MKRVLGIIIILLISTAITYGAKPTISISDLKSTSGITKEEVVQLTSKLVNELVMTDAFEVIDRAKRDEILREQGFNVSGATDPSLNLIKIGKLLGVQKMIGGSIGKLGNVFSVDLQLLDVNTSRINLVFSREYTGDVSVLLGAMKEAANTFANGIIGSKEETQELRVGSKTIVNAAQPMKEEAKISAATIQQPIKQSNINPNADGLSYTGTNESGFKEYINLKDGSVLIEVTEGEFYMGDKGQPIWLDSYCIGKYEVTIGQYKKYCLETRKIFPEQPAWNDKPDLPIVNISWDEAIDYCKWAGLKLPTEAQWEKAARGNDKRKYPWGNMKPDEGGRIRINCIYTKDYIKGNFKTLAIDSFSIGVSPYGIYNMLGNVDEWCNDWYDNVKQTNKNPIGPQNDAGWGKVIRGGSWNSTYGDCEATVRNYKKHNKKYDKIGFRVAK